MKKPINTGKGPTQKTPPAPAVYRPQPLPKVLQTKTGNPVAPPVTRPLVTQPPKPTPPPVTPSPARSKVAQAKLAGPPQLKKPAPPIASSQKKPPLHKPKPPVSQKTIQRSVIAGSRGSGVIQAKYAVGTYVTVLETQTANWYGVVKAQLHNGYKIRVGGSDHDVDIPEDNVVPHPAFAGRYEERRNGDTAITAGGTWTAREYNSKMGREDPTARGVHMLLEFMPNHTVDATCIVLVQTVTAIKNNAVYYKDESVRQRAKFNVSIDQHGTSASPEYAANPETSGGTLGSAPVQNGAGGHGYRIKLFNPERWATHEATLQDNPHMRGIVSFSQQRFETAAIAATGNDKGRYYGSVKWGWAWQPGGIVKLIPLEVESFGAASPQFRESAKQWNQTRTTTGRVPVQIPLHED